jgi:hypothetical protein
LRIVDQYFEKAVLVEQDILGTNDRVKDFLQNVEENLRPLFKEPMLKHQTSVERWNAFQNTFQKLSKEVDESNENNNNNNNCCNDEF